MSEAVCCEKFDEYADGSLWQESAFKQDLDDRWSVITTIFDEAADGSMQAHSGLVPIEFCPFCGADLGGEST
ncbi:hypothetical protein [Halostella sp. PRR32]|uniref:hypothetical protein n=1 Tax=Halostella sp. PRR32 TaxID=3098147 RepID=UPI002B1E32DE|nr:hypothetical protein [Halostella sp. PRR32]